MARARCNFSQHLVTSRSVLPETWSCVLPENSRVDAVHAVRRLSRHPDVQVDQVFENLIFVHHLVNVRLRLQTAGGFCGYVLSYGMKKQTKTRETPCPLIESSSCFVRASTSIQSEEQR